MPRYRFRLSLYERLLDGEDWVDFADAAAALRAARRLARALLDLADPTVPWTDGALVIESGDGSEPVILPLRDVAADLGMDPGPGLATTRH
ncbi:hypothetical protein [uncultured Methylobacterium sp.]|uniref:DUF6894 family protein n=1 Tax=uncultured Methylobacterium sp. TaxID=157278 RepID=UPI002596822F|nr:hypothetical protein [uncultured Methylobacterium sp.]